MLHYQVQRVGRNRGVPRVWLQGLVLVRAGFHAGASFATHIAAMRLELVLDGQGELTVSAKARGDARLPIVDLNSAKLLAELADLAAVRIVVPRPGRIVIEALASDLRRRARLDRAWSRLTQGDSLFIGSVSHGGGVMSHALHRGFAQAGIDCVLCFANEIRPDLLDHAARVNDAWESDTVALAAPLQEIAFDPVATLPMVDVLDARAPA
jgi:DNA (cytosine-5)-methyltransferase 1